MKTYRITFALAAGFLLTLAGCNTMHGFGEDLSHLGNSISNKAAK